MLIVKSFFRNLLRSVGLDLVKTKNIMSFELSIINWMKIEKINTLIDVGANEGQYAKHMRKLGYSGTIISFEPTSDAYLKLLINSKKDRKWIIAPQMAIGDKNGQVDINISKNSVSSSILNILQNHVDLEKDSIYKNSEKVTLSTLDFLMGRIIPEQEKMLLKIDTQGYEMQVLNGLNENLSKIKGIQIEMSLVELYDGQSLYFEIINFLNGRNFILYSLKPGFKNRDTQQIMQFDAFFVKLE